MKKQWDRGRMTNRDLEEVKEGTLVFLLFVQCGPFHSMVHSLDLPLLFGVWSTMCSCAALSE